MARTGRLGPRLLPVLLGGFVLSTGGCGLPRFGAPDAATSEGRQTLSLWRGEFVAALAVGALVLGLIAWVTLRYRRRSDAIPGQRSGSPLAEIFYVGTPIAVVAVIFAFSATTEIRVTEVTAHPALVVRVTGFQWGWRFAYPPAPGAPAGTPGPEVIGSGERTSGAFASPEMILPLRRTTVLVLRTNDVIHSFWVPRFLSKRDLIPGIDNRIDVTPDRTGVYDGRCAEFCGLDHWRMDFRVRVVASADFDRWLSSRQLSPAPFTTTNDTTTNDTTTNDTTTNDTTDNTTTDNTTTSTADTRGTQP